MNINRIKAAPGETLEITATAEDPDGDEINLLCWQCREVDRYPGRIDAVQMDHARFTITIPEDTSPGDDIHLIVEGRDQGTPAITRYKRVIVEIVLEIM